LNTPGEAIVKWAIAERSKNSATMGPKGKFTTVLVTGPNLPVCGINLRRDVVMGSEKSLLRRKITTACARCKNPMITLYRRSLAN